MQFSDTTNRLGIVEKIDSILYNSSTANTAEYPLADKAREVNEWYRIVLEWIFQVCGNWSFDDSNYTNLPIAKTNCVLGQDDYSFPSDYVEIEGVSYKDADGIWHKLIPLDSAEISESSPQSGVRGGVTNLDREEFLKTNGTPIYYDKFANSFRLYPAADRTSTDGDSIRVYHTRDAALASSGTTSATGGPFVAGSTTQVPGFSRAWHPVLAYGAALNWTTRQEIILACEKKIAMYKDMIEKHYSRRKKDERQRLVPRYQSNR